MAIATMTAGTALIIGAAITAAATATSIVAQKMQANSQMEYQNKVTEQQREYQDKVALANAEYQNALVKNQNDAIVRNYALADEAENLKTRSIQSRVSQEDEQNMDEQTELARRGAAARATTRVAAAESGVSGLSVRALLDDFMRSESRFRDISQRNIEYGHRQATDELRGVSSEAQGRREGVQPYVATPTTRPPVTPGPYVSGGPSILGGALKVGGDIFGSYTRLYGTKNPTIDSTPSFAGADIGGVGYGANPY